VSWQAATRIAAQTPAIANSTLSGRFTLCTGTTYTTSRMTKQASRKPPSQRRVLTDDDHRLLHRHADVLHEAVCRIDTQGLSQPPRLVALLSCYHMILFISAR
jgi:hypothetical protein